MANLVWIVILGFIVMQSWPKVVEYIKEEKIAQQAGEIAREFNSSYKPETPPTIVNTCNVTCFEGKKIIEIDGKIYNLGVVKNTWGDLDPVDCD